MKQLLHLMKQLQRHAGHRLYFHLLGMVCASLLEGAGILLLIPMLSMSGVLGGAEPELPVLSRLPEQAGLLMVLAVFVAVVAGQSLLQRSLGLHEVKMITRFINHVRLETFHALLKVKWDFFVKQRNSDLANLLTSELGRVTGGLQLFLQLMASVVFTVVQIMLAFWISPVLTLLVMASGMLLILFSRRFVRQSKLVGNETTELAKSYLAGITDHFNGIKDIKSNRLEHARSRWLRTWSDRMERERMAYVRIRTQSNLYFQMTAAVLLAAFIFISAEIFHSRLEQLILIVLIFTRLWPRFLHIQKSTEQIAATIPAFQEMTGLKRRCEEAVELSDSQILARPDVPKLRLGKGITCHHIDFRYDPDEENYALKNISLHIPAGGITAIIGPSGAGKSTLIDVIMGLLKPESGYIAFDDNRLSDENLLQFRSAVSYVPQDPFLFNGSIRENLLMVKEDADEAELWEALKFSSADEFVGKLPKGLDTFVGDRGVRLSGGERQRLVLARAVLKKPSVLVLDEATSALDPDNESKILDAIARMKGAVTVILVTHRMSALRNADQVIELDGGRIVRTIPESRLA